MSVSRWRHVDGIAASAASLVAGGATLVAENATVMVHRPWTGAMGDAEEFRRQADVLDRAWAAMLTTCARRTGRRPATIERRVADAGGEWLGFGRGPICSAITSLRIGNCG